jgi:membrane protein implicated in regulation of membrane protease activity
MPDPAFMPWFWLVGGLILCAAELAIPGAFLLWIGFAAVTLGLIELIFPLPFEWALILFAFLAVAYSLVGRKVYGGLSTGGDDMLNRRADAYVGREFTLIEAIADGEGKAKVLDTVWRVTGPDIPAGARVRVTGVSPQGTVLIVEAV